MSLFLGIMLVALVVVTIILKLAEKVQAARISSAHGATKNELSGLSNAAQKLVTLYRSIPETNRPDMNIIDVVHALDVKYGKNQVNNHFSDTYDHGRKFSWNPRDYYWKPVKPLYPEYLELKNSMDDVLKAIRQQEHAIRVAAVEGGLEDAKTLLARLREESTIVTSVTKELLAHHNGNN